MRRLVALAVALSLVACRSGGTDAKADGIDSCLEKAGYGGSLGNVDYRRQHDATFDAALTGCYQAVGIELPAPGVMTRALDEILLAEVRCLRDKGWDVPDPQRGKEGGLNMGNLNDFVPEDQIPAFQTDDQACADDIVPQGKGVDINDPVPD